MSSYSYSYFRKWETKKYAGRQLGPFQWSLSWFLVKEHTWREKEKDFWTVFPCHYYFWDLLLEIYFRYLSHIHAFPWISFYIHLIIIHQVPCSLAQCGMFTCTVMLNAPFLLSFLQWIYNVAEFCWMTLEISRLRFSLKPYSILDFCNTHFKCAF